MGKAIALIIGPVVGPIGGMMLGGSLIGGAAGDLSDLSRDDGTDEIVGVSGDRENMLAQLHGASAP
jgi:hypothetical protein